METSSFEKLHIQVKCCRHKYSRQLRRHTRQMRRYPKLFRRQLDSNAKWSESTDAHCFSFSQRRWNHDRHCILFGLEAAKAMLLQFPSLYRPPPVWCLKKISIFLEHKSCDAKPRRELPPRLCETFPFLHCTKKDCVISLKGHLFFPTSLAWQKYRQTDRDGDGGEIIDLSSDSEFSL